MVNRVVTGAHYGLRDWMIQRISAVMMAIYIVFVAGWLLTHEFNYGNWKLLFAGTAMRSVSLLFLLAVFYHAWIGVRDIVMDYVKPPIVRLLIHVLVILALLLYVIWSAQILWGN
jgi:succinate dehydrogenase / fumarate reductase membrane anchor subunit